MTNELTTTQTDKRSDITQAPSMADFASAADAFAGASTFTRVLAGKSANTRIAYQTDLATWAQYLTAAGLDTVGCDYYGDPECWQGVTYGVVVAYVEWMKGRGFAIASINRKLSVVRVFCQMAAQAGVIPGESLAMIQTVGTIRRGAGLEIDRQRDQTRIDRPNAKKAKSVELTPDQAKALKTQPDSPQGRRDALLMALLLDHGLRAGEVAALTLGCFNLKRSTMTFWRDKVEKEQTHKLTTDALTALRAYIDAGDITGLGPLLRASIKGGKLDKGGMSEVAISARVKALGEKIGVEGLSAHDCRHFWATDATRNHTDGFTLMQAGGWTSMQTVQRYVDASKIANEGVKLSK
jgi:integrase